MKTILFIALILTTGAFSAFGGQAPSHSEIVKSVSISADCKKIASASLKELKIWDVETGKLLMKYNFGGRYVKILPDNSSMILMGDTAKLIEMATGKTIRKYVHPNGQMKGVATVSNDGKLLACNTFNNNIVLFSIETGEIVSPHFQICSGDYSFVRDIAFSQDGKTILVAESSSNTYCKIDLQTMTMKRETTTLKLRSICQSNKYLFIGCLYGLNGASNFYINSLSGNAWVNFEDETTIDCMAYNPTDLEMVANGTGMGLMIWDLKKGKSKKLKGHDAVINDVEFSSDGKFIVTCSGDRNVNKQDFTVRMWDVQKMKELKVFVE
jgi:WD40 repeat protein